MMFSRILRIGTVVASGSYGIHLSSCSKSVADMRQEYTKSSMDENELPDDPMRLFSQWLSEAVQEKVIEPNAMCLSTCCNNRPSARMVLLKFFDEKGFVFFTNYDSRKGSELSRNENAALTFWWGTMERSIRIEGTVTKIPEADSVKYFHMRPKSSQLGAWASDQSRQVVDREALDRQYEVVARKLTTLQEKNGWTELPKPSNWGGYRLTPHRIEFWMGRKSRLHDRIVYEKLSSPDYCGSAADAVTKTKNGVGMGSDITNGSESEKKKNILISEKNDTDNKKWIMWRLQP